MSTKGDSENYPDFAKKVEASEQSGDSSYDMIADHSYGIGYCTIKGLVTDLMTLQYLDWEKPWWPDNLIKQATINNKLYFASGDMSANVIYMMYVTFFNRNMIADKKLEDPYELVKSGKWTLDKMFELSAGLYEDTDNSGTPTLGDTYGQYAYKLHFDAYLTGSGITFLDTSNSEVKINEAFTGDKMEALVSKLTDFYTSKDKAYMLAKTDNLVSYFATQKCLFWTDRCQSVTTFKNNEVPFGVVPIAKYDENQDQYYTVLGHQFSLYAIPTDAKDKNMSAAVMECYASESYRTLTPQLYEITMKYRFTDDATSAEMFDIIRSSVAFDLGRIFAQNFNFPYNTFGNTIAGNGNWTRAIAVSVKTVWPTSLEKLMNAFS